MVHQPQNAFAPLFCGLASNDEEENNEISATDDNANDDGRV